MWLMAVPGWLDSDVKRRGSSSGPSPLTGGGPDSSPLPPHSAFLTVTQLSAALASPSHALWPKSRSL